MISTSYNQIKAYFLHEEPEIVEVAQINNLQKIKNVAFPIIKELAALGVSITIVVAFGASGSIPFMLALVISSAIINLALRYFETTKKQGNLKVASENLRAFSYGIMQATYLGTFIHELGHFLAAKQLQNIKKISITLFGNGGGVTSYHHNGTTEIGNYFGKEISRGLISASGTALEIVCVTLLIITAIKIYKKHPVIAKALLIQSIFRIFNSVLYALSAFTSKSKGHDFVSIAKNLNINPIVSAIIIVGIPILTILITAICSKSFRKDLSDMKISIVNFLTPEMKKQDQDLPKVKKDPYLSDSKKQALYFSYLFLQCYILRSNSYYLGPIWILEKLFLKKNIFDYSQDIFSKIRKLPIFA